MATFGLAEKILDSQNLYSMEFLKPLLHGIFNISTPWNFQNLYSMEFSKPLLHGIFKTSTPWNFQNLYSIEFSKPLLHGIFKTSTPWNFQYFNPLYLMWVPVMPTPPPGTGYKQIGNH